MQAKKVFDLPHRLSWASLQVLEGLTEQEEKEAKKPAKLQCRETPEFAQQQQLGPTSLGHSQAQQNIEVAISQLGQEIAMSPGNNHRRQ